VENSPLTKGKKNRFPHYNSYGVACVRDGKSWFYRQVEAQLAANYDSERRATGRTCFA